MATPPEDVRGELAVITAAAATELRGAAGESVSDVLDALDLIVPSFYDAAGELAVAWFDEIRAESAPVTSYLPRIIGDPATDWIEREVETFLRSLDGDADQAAERGLDEALRLAEKEVARGYRDSILGNVRMDDDAIGWSRVTRPGACKFCLMLAGRGSVYTKATAEFAAHTNCHCAVRPEFRNGEHGPEASVIQYVASSKRPRSKRKLAERNAKIRAYLNQNFPDPPG